VNKHGAFRAKRAAYLAHALRERVVRGDDIRPDLLYELVLAHQPAAPLAENLEHPVRFRAQDPLCARRILEATALAVENEAAEA
jgi:hypothetical protein